MSDARPASQPARRVARSIHAAIALLLVGVLTVASGCATTAEARRADPTSTVSGGASRTSFPNPIVAPAAPVDTSNRNDPRLARIGFRTAGHLRDHFRKHGHEFGRVTEAQYLKMAQTLRDAPLSKRVIETTQANGTISRFDRREGSFIAFDHDLTIRTFFRPDDGEDYFWRAARRRR